MISLGQQRRFCCPKCAVFVAFCVVESVMCRPIQYKKVTFEVTRYAVGNGPIGGVNAAVCRTVVPLVSRWQRIFPCR